MEHLIAYTLLCPQKNFLQGAAQQAAITKVKENLPTASQFLQDQIKSYLKL
jgi:hypothetical protein